MECDSLPDCHPEIPPSAVTVSLIGWIVFLSATVITTILFMRTKLCAAALEWRRAFVYVWMIQLGFVIFYLLAWYNELFHQRVVDGLIYNHYRSLFLAVFSVLIGIPIATYFDLGWHDGLAIAFLGAASHIVAWLAEGMESAAGRWIIFGLSVFIWVVSYWIFYLRLARRQGDKGIAGVWWLLAFWVLIVDILYHVNWALYIGAFLYSLTTWGYIGLIIDVLAYIAMAWYMALTHGISEKNMGAYNSVPNSAKRLQEGY